MTLRIYCLGFCFLVIRIVVCLRADPLDLNLTEVGRWPPQPQGPVSQVIATGSNALAMVGQTLVILDTSDRTNPRYLATYRGSASAYSQLAVSGDLALLTGVQWTSTTSARLVLDVVSIAVPAQPRRVEQLITTLDKIPTCKPIVSGKRLYVGTTYGLATFSFENPESPSLISNLVMPWSVRSLNISSNYLFAAGGDIPNQGEVRVFEISDSSSPVVVTNYSVGRAVLTAALSGDTLFVGTAGTNGDTKESSIEILNVSDPRAPIQQERIEGVQAWELAINGSTLVAAELGKVRLFDIADLANINETSRIETLQGATSVFFSGLDLYVGAGYEGLRIVDTNDPRQPQIVGKYETIFGASDIVVSGNHAFTVGSSYGFAVVDIANPRSPFPVATLPLAGSITTRFGQRFTKLSIFKDIVFVPLRVYGSSWNFTNDLVLIDVKDRTQPIIRSSLRMKIGFQGAVCAGASYVVVVESGSNEGAGTLSTLDVSNPENPKVLGNLSFSTNDFPNGVVIFGSYAYVGVTSSDPVTLVSRARVEIIDLTDPTQPRFAGSPILADGPLQISGQRLFSQAVGAVYDLSDPVHPQKIAQSSFTGNGTWFASGDRLYTVGLDHLPNLDAFDISNPTQPRNLGHLALALGGHGRGLYVQGRYAYIADLSEGVKVVDLTRPANPQAKLVYRKEFQGGAVAGDFAYLARADGLEIVDFKNLEQPSVVGTYKSQIAGSGYYSVAVKYPWAYIVEAYGKVQIFDVSTPAQPLRKGSLKLVNEPAQAIKIVEDRLYVSSLTNQHSILIAFNLDPPDQPRRIGQISEGFSDFSVGGGYAYLVASENGLAVVDFRDATKPRQVGRYGGYGELRVVSVCASGTFAYVVGHIMDPLDSRLDIVDVSIPEAPKSKGSLMLKQYSWFWRVIANGSYLYLSGRDGVLVVDVSDPMAPYIVGRNSAALGEIGLSGENLYIAGYDGFAVLPLFQPRGDFGQEVYASAGKIHFDIFGSPRLSGRIQRSADLQKWEDWQPIGLGENFMKTLDDRSDRQRQFYRVVTP